MRTELHTIEVFGDNPELEKKFEYMSISVESDLTLWTYDFEYNIFNVKLRYDSNEFVGFTVGIDDLELFANGILKQIEIIRREFSEEIKECKLNGKEV